MTKTEYRRALKALGLSVTKAGPFLGITSRQSFRIAAGAADLPLAAQKLLLVMIYLSVRPESADILVKDRKMVLAAASKIARGALPTDH